MVVAVLLPFDLQVNVETVLEQVKQGSVSACSIIRSQHDFLSGGMDREQKAKRKLVSSLRLHH